MRAEPLKNLSDIQKIKKCLRRNTRDLALFLLGISCELRIPELLQIRFGDLSLHRPKGYSLKFNNKLIPLSVETVLALRRLQISKNYSNSDFVFTGYRGRHLARQTVFTLSRSWFSILGSSGNYGPESLRKTFGYQAYHAGLLDLTELCRRFGYQRRVV